MTWTQAVEQSTLPGRLLPPVDYARGHWSCPILRATSGARSSCWDFPRLSAATSWNPESAARVRSSEQRSQLSSEYSLTRRLGARVSVVSLFGACRKLLRLRRALDTGCPRQRRHCSRGGMLLGHFYPPWSFLMGFGNGSACAWPHDAGPCILFLIHFRKAQNLSHARKKGGMGWCVDRKGYAGVHARHSPCSSPRACIVHPDNAGAFAARLKRPVQTPQPTARFVRGPRT